MLNMGGTLFAFISWILAIVGTGWVWPEYSEGSAWAPLIGVFGFVMFILALIGASSTAESIANNTETDTRRRVIWRTIPLRPVPTTKNRLTLCGLSGS